MEVNRNDLTFENFKKNLGFALELGFNFLTCIEYFYTNKSELKDQNVFVLRHDVDLDKDMKNSLKLAKIEAELGIKSTFFIRLHDPEYNIFDFRTYKNIKDIIALGHEIGVHTEALDFGLAVNEDPSLILKKEISSLETVFDLKIDGAACHGDISPINNLDFWKNHTPSEFGLSYEAYDNNLGLFHSSKYISNAGQNWKCYENGLLVQGDKRNFYEHLLADKDKKDLLYNVLVHPRPWYESHWRID